MQRWIVLAACVFLLGGGGAFAMWNRHQNKPDAVWSPLVLNANSTDNEKESLQKQVDTFLRGRTVLATVVKDLGLVARFQVGSEEEAIDELSRRMFIEIGQANPPANTSTSLNVGVRGKAKEHALIGEISSHLMKELSGHLASKKSTPRKDF